jgi:hypothetical protein
VDPGPASAPPAACFPPAGIAGAPGRSARPFGVIPVYPRTGEGPAARDGGTIPENRLPDESETGPRRARE